jgi:hypothetical protein
MNQLRDVPACRYSARTRATAEVRSQAGRQRCPLEHISKPAQQYHDTGELQKAEDPEFFASAWGGGAR